MKPDVFLRAVRDAGLTPGRPVSPSERARRKSLKLPKDLLGFLKRANGVDLGEAELLPLREIRGATEILYQDQDDDESLPETWLGLTDDVDALLVFDLRSRKYLVIDDETTEIGGTWEEALEWLAARYLPPRNALE